MPRYPLRKWLPFTAAAVVVLLLTLAVTPCMCWRGTVIQMERLLSVAGVGLLFARHAWAFGRKEPDFPWLFYLLLTLAIPFIVGLIDFIALGDAPH